MTNAVVSAHRQPSTCRYPESFVTNSEPNKALRDIHMPLNPTGAHSLDASSFNPARHTYIGTDIEPSIITLVSHSDRDPKA